MWHSENFTIIDAEFHDTLGREKRRKIHYSGRNSRVVFTGGSFRNGVQVPIGVFGGGVWGRVKGGGGGEFCGEAGRWGGNRQRNRQATNAHAFVKTTL